MNKINWKVRVHNPAWWATVVIAILAPILAYMGISYQDLTSWSKLGEVLIDAISNPYIIGLVLISVWNTISDPTTKGFGDSPLAMTYDAPKDTKTK